MLLGPLPGEVLRRMRPRPAGFSVPITDQGNRLTWRGRLTLEEPGKVEQIEVEVGYRKSQGKTEADVLDLVWHLQELARLGWRTGLQPAMLSRHADVKPTTPDPKAWAAAKDRAAEISADLERQAGIDAEAIAEAERLTVAP